MNQNNEAGVLRLLGSLYLQLEAMQIALTEAQEKIEEYEKEYGNK